MESNLESNQASCVSAVEAADERDSEERKDGSCRRVFGQSGSQQENDDGCCGETCRDAYGEVGSSADSTAYGEDDSNKNQPEGSASCEDDRDGNRHDSRHNKDLGERGERAARQYLERRGFEIVDMNWRCPYGEADIIAIEDGVLAFIEVKTRADEEMGFPEDAVTKEKRARYEKIAASYLMDHDHGDMPVRFDVISITMIASDRAFLRHHRNAFGLGD